MLANLASLGNLAACFAGSIVATLAVFCGADRYWQAQQKPPVIINGELTRCLEQQNTELRQDYFSLLRQRADLEGKVEELASDRDSERSRAFVAECRADRAEGEAIGLRVMLDSARRGDTKVIPAGVAEADRIPPAGVPVPVP